MDVANTDERVKNLIAKFVLKYNYWGYLFSRVRRRPMKELPSPMGVSPERDGTITLYYNPEMVSQTSDENMKVVIEHEGMHLLNKHLSRYLRILSYEVEEERKKDKGEIWNVAADCAVNEQAKIQDELEIAGRKWKICLPEKYGLERGHMTEYYFYELLKTAKTKEISTAGMIGDHSGWSKNIKGVADLSSLSRKVESFVQNVIKDSVKSFSKDRGSIPSHIAQLIEEALKPPRAPYYQIIRKLIRASRISAYKRSPTKINRKRTYVFHLGDNSDIPVISPFPGRTRDLTFNIVTLIDTSGSMSQDDILEALSGCKDIIEHDKHCHTTVLEVDAAVEKEYVIKRIKDIQFNVKGRGGTTLFPGLERARELNPDVCLCFTDGYCESINEIDRKKLPKRLIWAITPGGTAKTVNKTGFVVRLKN